jgi:hypothetical protein
MPMTLGEIAMGLGAWSLLSVVFGMGMGKWLSHCDRAAERVQRGAVRTFGRTA